MHREVDQSERFYRAALLPPSYWRFEDGEPSTPLTVVNWDEWIEYLANH